MDLQVAIATVNPGIQLTDAGIILNCTVQPLGTIVDLRLLMPYIGKAAGISALPAAGDEVLALFPGSDINQGVAIWGLYNGINQIPAGTSEDTILFMGRPGENIDATVLGNVDTHILGNDSHVIIGFHSTNVLGTHSTNVGGSHSTTVLGFQSLNVAGSQTNNIGGFYTQRVGGSHSTTVLGSKSEKILGSNATNTTGNRNETTIGAHEIITAALTVGALTMSILCPGPMTFTGATGPLFHIEPADPIYPIKFDAGVEFKGPVLGDNPK